MIRSVLVANRGEIARRVFRTCRDLGIATVAVFSDADADAPFVAEADRSVRLPGSAPSDTYLRADLVIDAAKRSGADAIHPGYGFLSENADFARQVMDAGLIWVGPAPETIEAMGSKIRAKELMAKAGVPMLSVDPDSATKDDFPLLVKASAGGGGRGMRVVTDPADLAGELTAAGAEALSAFGDDTVFVEPYLPTARHIEVQVMADTHGTVWVVGDRDCSIQRRHQKVVEEAPAPAVSDAVRKQLHDAARAACEAVGYVGAGTVEFLVSDAHHESGHPYFLEMNTRLQVEHPVTELVTGVDLVALQIVVAEGRELGEEPGEPHGHAVEVRLYAEDPADDWAPADRHHPHLRHRPLPQSGRVGLRIDSAVEAGSTVGIHYDAMIAKVVAHGADRDARRPPARRRAAAGAGARRHHERRPADEHPRRRGVRRRTSPHRLCSTSGSTRGPHPCMDEHALALAAGGGARARHVGTSRSRVLSRIPPAFRNVPSQPRTRDYRRWRRDHGAIQYERGWSRWPPGGRHPVTPAQPMRRGRRRAVCHRTTSWSGDDRRCRRARPVRDVRLPSPSSSTRPTSSPRARCWHRCRLRSSASPSSPGST